MNPAIDWSPGQAPAATYYAGQIVRPAAAPSGAVVTVLIGGCEVAGSDSMSRFIVTDQKDKKGNPLLVNPATGAMFSAGPEVVLAVL